MAEPERRIRRRRLARGWALGLSVACGANWFLMELLEGIIGGEGLGWVIALLPGLVILTTALAAWRWGMWGGLVLILEGIVPLVVFPVSAATIIMFFGPLAVAGLLFMGEALVRRREMCA
jgi:hypothetical protein